MTQKNTILVTGGAGFIGSSVVRKIIKKTSDLVVCLDNLSYAANLSNLTEVSMSDRYSFENGDIRDATFLKGIMKKYEPDQIMHLAAESHVDRSIESPLTFVDTNIVGTCQLLEASLDYYEAISEEKQNNFRFHHISTDEVFGSLNIGDPTFTENTTYDPRSPYAASKAASDHLVRAWGNTYGLPFVISNCSNNYGPHQFPEKLIPLTIIRALEGKSIPVYGSGEHIRDWLHVDDHAEALLLIIKEAQLGETYLVGGNNELSNIELVYTICEIIDDRIKKRKHSELIELVQDRPGHDARYGIDGSKMKKELGWTPSIEFCVGLEQTIDWYILNEGWWRSIIENVYDGRRLGKPGKSKLESNKEK